MQLHYVFSIVITSIQLIHDQLRLHLSDAIVNCTICATLTPNSTLTTEHETEVWLTEKHHRPPTP